MNPQIGKPGTAFEFPRTGNSRIQTTSLARNFVGCHRFASGYIKTTGQRKQGIRIPVLLSHYEAMKYVYAHVSTKTLRCS